MLGEKIFQLDLKISFENGPRKLQVNKFQKDFSTQDYYGLEFVFEFFDKNYKQKGHYENH